MYRQCFTIMLQDNYAPKHFMMSIVDPISKGLTSNLKCSDNYRHIESLKYLNFLAAQFSLLFYLPIRVHTTFLYCSLFIDHCSLKQYNIMYMSLGNQSMYYCSTYRRNLTVYRYCLCCSLCEIFAEKFRLLFNRIKSKLCYNVDDPKTV